MCRDTGPRHGQPGHDTAQAGRIGRAWHVGAGQALGWARAARKCWTWARGAEADALADARGERQGHWARGLGVLLGCWLCTWCTQPVFDPVRLSTVLESIFGHCS